MLLVITLVFLLLMVKLALAGWLDPRLSVATVFDERQRLVRGQSSSRTLFALFVWGTLLVLLDRLVFPLSLHFALFSFYCLGMTVFACSTHWQDSLIKSRLTPGRYLLFLIAIALVNAPLVWDGLISYGYDWQTYLLSRDSLAFFVEVFLLTVSGVVLLKSWSEQKVGEDD